VTSATRLAELAQQGHSLAVFPEGTFVDQPGLLPFHLGAFLAAARAGVPVLPLAIRGHRQLLPVGSWWPRRAALQVDICAAILPGAALQVDAPQLFAAAVELREAARRAIARHVDGA
jgi:1-acyl-sn-glycerol-3-phosphate acyltransferase